MSGCLGLGLPVDENLLSPALSSPHALSFSRFPSFSKLPNINFTIEMPDCTLPHEYHTHTDLIEDREPLSRHHTIILRSAPHP